MKKYLHWNFIVMLFAACFCTACSDEDETAGIPKLEVGVETIDFEQEGGKKTIEIIANRINWVAAVNTDARSWCSATADVQGKKTFLRDFAQQEQCHRIARSFHCRETGRRGA